MLRRGRTTSGRRRGSLMASHETDYTGRGRLAREADHIATLRRPLDGPGAAPHGAPMYASPPRRGGGTRPRAGDGKERP